LAKFLASAANPQLLQPADETLMCLDADDDDDADFDDVEGDDDASADAGNDWVNDYVAQTLCHKLRIFALSPRYALDEKAVAEYTGLSGQFVGSKTDGCRFAVITKLSS